MSTQPTSTNRESSFSTVEVVAVTCACCGVKAFDDDKSEWTGVIYFDDHEKAVENITSRDLDQPWRVEGDQAYCGDCLASMRCFLDGHDWAMWFTGARRYCDRCGVREQLAEPTIEAVPDGS